MRAILLPLSSSRNTRQIINTAAVRKNRKPENTENKNISVNISSQIDVFFEEMMYFSRLQWMNLWSY